MDRVCFRVHWFGPGLPVYLLVGSGSSFSFRAWCSFLAFFPRAGEVFLRKLRIAFCYLQRAEFFVAGVVGEVSFLKVLGLLSALLAGRLVCVVARVTSSLARPQTSLLIPLHAVVGCCQYRMDYFLCVFVAGSALTVLCSFYALLPCVVSAFIRLHSFGCFLPEEVLGMWAANCAAHWGFFPWVCLRLYKSPLCPRPMCRSAVVAAHHVSRDARASRKIKAPFWGPSRCCHNLPSRIKGLSINPAFKVNAGRGQTGQSLRILSCRTTSMPMSQLDRLTARPS